MLQRQTQNQFLFLMFQIGHLDYADAQSLPSGLRYRIFVKCFGYCARMPIRSADRRCGNSAAPSLAHFSTGTRTMVSPAGPGAITTACGVLACHWAQGRAMGWV